ncbi:probable Nucleolar protein 16 [Ustilago trichophora]|uniref:Nucleolar protein 16 n=1 Tax=Ustilago trichophora TaxID=86804 RepID=A0A5C3DTA4_9BASI|nr:probable Nucleolar protein 16 [Ustilago trichophora]
MANPRQRRKNRSSSTLKPSLNAKKQMKKKLVRAPTIHGADILKESYDPKLTLRQNYAKLGLVPSLDVRPDTGGVERVPGTATAAALSSAVGTRGEEKHEKKLVRKGMARVVRDQDGNIVDIVEAESEEDNPENITPWGKPLKSSIADSDQVETYMPVKKDTSKNAVVTQLENRATNAAPVKRHTSQLESQWLADLVAKYRDDTEAMAKDRKLNVWQKTQGEIKRAIKKAGGLAAFQ